MIESKEMKELRKIRNKNSKKHLKMTVNELTDDSKINDKNYENYTIEKLISEEKKLLAKFLKTKKSFENKNNSNTCKYSTDNEMTFNVCEDSLKYNEQEK